MGTANRNEPPSRTAVGVFGQSAPDEDLEAMAYRVGSLLAVSGCVLYCGGMGGVMASACRGMTDSGGLTVGILPTDTAADANPFVSIPIVTGMGEARNAILVKSVQGAIAIGKGYGTLSEIALALRRSSPVVLLASWEVEGGVAARGPEEAVEIVLRLISARN